MTEKNLDLKFERETKLVKLSRPYEFEGAKIAELTLSEPTVQDQLEAEPLANGSQAMLELIMLSKSSGIAIEFFQGIAMRDYRILSNGLNGFLDLPQPKPGE